MTAAGGSSASASVAVRVTLSPSATGLGDADRLAAAWPSAVSSMAISTERFRPSLNLSSGTVPSATVKVSCGCSKAWSSVMAIVAVACFCPNGILTCAGPLKSPASAVPSVYTSGMRAPALSRTPLLLVTVTVTSSPSAGLRGAALRLRTPRRSYTDLKLTCGRPLEIW